MPAGAETEMMGRGSETERICGAHTSGIGGAALSSPASEHGPITRRSWPAESRGGCPYGSRAGMT